LLLLAVLPLSSGVAVLSGLACAIALTFVPATNPDSAAPTNSARIDFVIE
jgi:hypothetical protein